MVKAVKRFRAGLAVGCTCLLIAVVLLVFVMFVEFPGLHQSDAAQHGTRATASVFQVTNTTGRTDSALIAVTLQSPPDLAGKTSTVHVLHLVSYSDGGRITVLVDPDDTGYSELPGEPFENSIDVQLGISVAVLVTVVGAAFLVSAFRSRRRARHADGGAAAARTLHEPPLRH
jgi:hypothetical protein